MFGDEVQHAATREQEISAGACQRVQAVAEPDDGGANPVAIGVDLGKRGPIGAAVVRCGVGVEGVDAAFKQLLKSVVERRFAERAAADLIPREGRQMAEVEDRRMPQRDSARLPSVVGQEREQRVAPGPRTLQASERRQRFTYQRQREQAFVVDHPAVELQAGALQPALEQIAGIFAGKLRAHPVADVKAQGDVGCFDAHCRRSRRLEPHLNAAFVGVPARSVREGVDLEITAEAAVDDVEDIEVEGGGDAGGVVIGCDEARLGFDEVDAEEQGVAVVAVVRAASDEQGASGAQEGVDGGGVEVADRAGEEDEQATTGGVAEVVEVCGEVAHDGVDLEVRPTCRHAVGGFVEEFIRDIQKR